MRSPSRGSRAGTTAPTGGCSDGTTLQGCKPELNTLRRNLFVTVNGNEVHTNRPDAVRLLWLESAFVLIVGYGH